MKKTMKVVVLLCIAIIGGMGQRAEAQIVGKTYQPGDTVVMDGIPSVVFKVDESGLHGTAISPYGKTAKEIEKMKKSAAKEFTKRIKKGESSQAELDACLEQIEASTKIPVMGRLKTVYQVEEWAASLPEGWRLPTLQDAEDFAKFYCGGIGKDYSITFKFVMKARDLTSDVFSQSNLAMLAFYGFICGDTPTPPVKFVQRYEQKLTGKNWFEIKDKFLGKEKTVAVKDF